MGLQNLLIIPCGAHASFLNPTRRTASERVKELDSHARVDRVLLPLLRC